MSEQLELIPSGRKPCPFCHSKHSTIKPVWKTKRFVACDDCKAGGPIRDTVEEAEQAWNDRYEPNTRRIIKGDDETQYAWCEAGEHPMNPTGSYCQECGRKVTE